MYFVDDTLDVSNNGTLFNLLQFVNIRPKSTAFEVSNICTEDNASQPSKHPLFPCSSSPTAAPRRFAP